jgi:hypothetical protein
LNVANDFEISASTCVNDFVCAVNRLDRAALGPITDGLVTLYSQQSNPWSAY